MWNCFISSRGEGPSIGTWDSSLGSNSPWGSGWRTPLISGGLSALGESRDQKSRSFGQRQESNRPNDFIEVSFSSLPAPPSGRFLIDVKGLGDGRPQCLSEHHPHHRRDGLGGRRTVVLYLGSMPLIFLVSVKKAARTICLPVKRSSECPHNFKHPLSL